MANVGYLITLVVGLCLLGIGIAIWPWSRKHDENGLGGVVFHKHRMPTGCWSAIIFNSVFGCGVGGYCWLLVLE